MIIEENAGSEASKKGKIYTGWVEKDITPCRPVLLAGQFHERISEGVKSPLLATVFALETTDINGDTVDQMMLGACDLVSISKDLQDEVRIRLHGKLKGFDIRKLFLNATHTHTAPLYTGPHSTSWSHIYRIIPEAMKPLGESENLDVMPPQEYREFLITQLCGAFITAWETRSPGAVSWQLSHAVVGHNRRIVYDDGSALMYGNTDNIDFEGYEGPTDHGIELLYVWNAKKQLTGVFVNAACPSQVLEMKNFISADYWGEVRRLLKDRYGHDLCILPLCGAAGDQSPRDLVRRGRGEPSMYDIPGMMEIGRRIAAAVMDSYDAAYTHMTDRSLFRHEVFDLDLPLRKVTRSEYESAISFVRSFFGSRDTGERVNYSEMKDLHMPGGIIERYEQQNKVSFYRTEIHVIRLGDIAAASNPFELFTSFGLQIKARSKALQTFIIELACDSGKYLPSKKAVEGGHYSAVTASCKVGPEGGKILVDQIVDRINKMWEDHS